MYTMTPILVMAREIPCSFISFFLYNKDIFCYFGSFLVDYGCFQLTSTTSTTFLLLEMVVIKHGCQVVSCSHQQTREGCFFSSSWCSWNGCAMPPTLFEVSNITSIQYLLISYHFKCYEMLHPLSSKEVLKYFFS